MTVTEERLHVSDFPKDVHDEVAEKLKHYSVAITRIEVNGRREGSCFIGSGTLATVNGLPCILTADHVLAKLRPEDKIGLFSDFDGGLRRHAFDQQHAQAVRLASGSVDADGPDLGVIILPDAGIGMLRAEKSFFNVDSRIARFSSNYPEIKNGMWFNFGVLGEGAADLGSQGAFEQVTGHWGMCGVSANPNVSHRAGFEYLDSRVPYDGMAKDIPSTFGGMSGGGFWQVLLKRDTSGKIIPVEYILSGITFYESDIENGQRLLRSHGRDAIYEYIPKHLPRR